VHLGRDWFELGAESGWLPIPTPGDRWNWDLDLDLPAGFDPVCSTGGPAVSGPSHPPGSFITISSPTLGAARSSLSSNGVDVIALRRCERVGRVIGNVRREYLEGADRVVGRALGLWVGLAGPLDRPCPPIVVLDRPASTFCYARPGFVRLASGILEQRGQSAIIHHEIGHLWWGTGVRFDQDSLWLAESLAEYTLHLAEDDDVLPGYRASTLEGLRTLGVGAAPPETGMAELARGSGRRNAAILRAKGGFLVSMLHEIIGRPNLERTLHEVVRAGRTRALDAYTFFALASWCNGATLDWFVNQWVFSDASMRFELGPIQVAPDPNGGFGVRFRVRSRGAATPGAPVELAIGLAGGAEHRVHVRLETGVADVEVRTAARPLAVTIDPATRWYADVPSKTTRIHS
jgi:hypothetical protein